MNDIYTTAIAVRTQFVGFHCWPGAPDEVAFLRTLHRHVFHVRLEVSVGHDDRQVEFFMLQTELNRYIKDVLSPYLAGTPQLSCEQLALAIYHAFKVSYLVNSVTVSEDGENEGIIYNVPGTTVSVLRELRQAGRIQSKSDKAAE